MKVKFDFKNNYNFNDLISIMALLRSENGCVWDREQDHKSIRNNFIEEVYEAVEAIDTSDTSLLKEELGDVLLQVVFHAQIENEKDGFDIDGVCDGICKKLIYRHPHVFGDVKAETSSQVLDNWNDLKKIEKNQSTAVESMDAVSRALPSLMRAQKVIKRAKKENIISVDVLSSADRIVELCSILKEEKKDKSVISQEILGKILFEGCKIASSSGMDAEQSLYDECEVLIKNSGV